MGASDLAALRAIIQIVKLTQVIDVNQVLAVVSYHDHENLAALGVLDVIAIITSHSYFIPVLVLTDNDVGFQEPRVAGEAEGNSKIALDTVAFLYVWFDHLVFVLPAVVSCS